MRVIGWDVGGAHLKAVLWEDGVARRALQLACPLWQGTDRLAASLVEAGERLGPAALHAATMTGELADVFASRAEGVAAIAAMLADALGPRVGVYAGAAGFVAAGEAGGRAEAVASANWHATASLAARLAPDGLLVDLGSTTTDIVPLAGGRVAARGASDAARLSCGELVYTGLVRSPVMSLAERAPFAGAWTTLACEHFATAADVHRLLGTLPEGADLLPAADGRAQTEAASRGRLARMIGRDADEAGETAWRALAGWFAERQLRRLEDAVRLVDSARAAPGPRQVVATGIGRALVGRLAGRLGWECATLSGLLGVAAGDCGEALDACAPAMAVAVLAAGL